MAKRKRVDRATRAAAALLGAKGGAARKGEKGFAVLPEEQVKEIAQLGVAARRKKKRRKKS